MCSEVSSEWFVGIGPRWARIQSTRRRQPLRCTNHLGGRVDPIRPARKACHRRRSAHVKGRRCWCRGPPLLSCARDGPPRQHSRWPTRGASLNGAATSIRSPELCQPNTAIQDSANRGMEYVSYVLPMMISGLTVLDQGYFKSREALRCRPRRRSRPGATGHVALRCRRGGTCSS